MGHKPRAHAGRQTLWSSYATMEAKTFALAAELSKEATKREIRGAVSEFTEDIKRELRERLASVDGDEAKSAVSLVIGDFHAKLTERLESASWEVPPLIQQAHRRQLQSIVSVEERSDRPALSARRKLIAAADSTIGDWAISHAESEADDLLAALDKLGSQ